MKKLLSFILVVCLVFLCGCGNNLEATYGLKYPETKYDNNIDYNDVITQEVDILEYADAEYARLLNDYTDVELAFGLEVMRTMKDGEGERNYSVHKVKQGGLLYVFYGIIQSWYYVVKELSSADFSKIDTGSTPEEVLEIDPATQVYLNELLNESKVTYYTDLSVLVSFHYLTDGCMHIYWRYKDGKPQVLRKEYYEDYMESTWQEGITTYHCCKVLDKDLLWYDPEKAETESE